MLYISLKCWGHLESEMASHLNLYHNAYATTKFQPLPYVFERVTYGWTAFVSGGWNLRLNISVFGTEIRTVRWLNCRVSSWRHLSRSGRVRSIHQYMLKLPTNHSCPKHPLSLHLDSFSNTCTYRINCNYWSFLLPHYRPTGNSLIKCHSTAP